MAWPKPGSPHYRPPRGPGYGGPAKGAGWGGDRRPEGQPTMAEALRTGTLPKPNPEHMKIGRMEAKEYRERLKARLERTIEAYDNALNSGNPQLALAAAKQIEDRVFGQAKQVVETQEDTRTPEEIRADIERKKREAGIE